MTIAGWRVRFYRNSTSWYDEKRPHTVMLGIEFTDMKRATRFPRVFQQNPL